MLEEKIAALKEKAIENGVFTATLMPTKDIIVGDWVLQKCEFGCGKYGNCFTCPPFTPEPSETSETMGKYKRALLIEYKGLHDVMQWKKIQEDMHKLERSAFLSGFPKALAYVCGGCKLCGGPCPAEGLEEPKKSDLKKCRKRMVARPSMEACGIDVYNTVRNAGLELNFVQDKESSFNSYCLLLLD